MATGFFSLILMSAILVLNVSLKDIVGLKYQSPLICVNSFAKNLNFGTGPQMADALWIRFLQELDAYNQLTIAEAHLCPNKTSSWHFQVMDVAFDMDKKFYEIMLYAPLLISVTIGDAAGASILFDKAVDNFPNDWRILYRASYQAMIEEKNKKKAADLLYRAGKNGAPAWVMSLAGGLFNESGDRIMAERIYNELLGESKDEYAARRLKDKLDRKIQNYFEPLAPSSKKPGER